MKILIGIFPKYIKCGAPSKGMLEGKIVLN